MSKKSERKKARKALATTLVRMYYASIFSKSAQRDYTTNRHHQKDFKDLTESERKHFLKVADVVEECDADPREYITAQFQSFAEYSSHLGRFMIPMPHQLHTLAAVVRYQRYKGQQETRDARRAPKIETVSVHSREERKLAGLARINRTTVDDVLTEYPEEFTKEFLKSKGVWSVVKDVWLDRSSN